jgi:hypothetical protein
MLARKTRELASYPTIMLMIKAFSDIYHECPKIQAIEIKDVNYLDLGPGRRTKKMLKMKDEPTMCMKTNRCVTTCPPV